MLPQLLLGMAAETGVPSRDAEMQKNQIFWVHCLLGWVGKSLSITSARLSQFVIQNLTESFDITFYNKECFIET